MAWPAFSARPRYESERAQAFIYKQTLSVALLADLIHNFGDALTAIPLAIAFFIRSARGERLAGLAVVLAIFISALVALGQTIERLSTRARCRISGS